MGSTPISAISITRCNTMATTTQILIEERKQLRDELMDLINSGKWNNETTTRIWQIRVRLAEIHADNERRFAQTLAELESLYEKIGG